MIKRELKGLFGRFKSYLYTTILNKEDQNKVGKKKKEKRISQEKQKENFY